MAARLRAQDVMWAVADAGLAAVPARARSCAMPSALPGAYMQDSRSARALGSRHWQECYIASAQHAHEAHRILSAYVVALKGKDWTAWKRHHSPHVRQPH